MTVKPLAQAGDHQDQPGGQGFDFSKPLFNTRTAAAYVDAPNAKAFRQWLHRRGIAVGHYGRELRIARVDLDRALGFAHRRKAS